MLENIILLYVEDEKELRDSVSEVLALKVGSLFIAKDGEEAYELYKKQSPDIIISDLGMPKLNGIELAKKIRQDDHSTRIILLTAHKDTESLLAATELKLTKYLTKPLFKDDLFEAIDLATQEMKDFKIVSNKYFTLTDGFLWEYSKKILYKDKVEVHLTPIERNILELLFLNLNNIVTYEQLVDKAWSNYDNYSLDSLKTMIKNLRRKLPKDTIKNIFGVGFKVNE